MPGELNLGRMLFGQPSAALTAALASTALAAALATSALTGTTFPASLDAAALTATAATSARVRRHPGRARTSHQGTQKAMLIANLNRSLFLIFFSISYPFLVAFQALRRVGRAWRALPPPPQARAQKQVEREGCEERRTDQGGRREGRRTSQAGRAAALEEAGPLRPAVRDCRVRDVREVRRRRRRHGVWRGYHRAVRRQRGHARLAGRDVGWRGCLSKGVRRVRCHRRVARIGEDGSGLQPAPQQAAAEGGETLARNVGGGATLAPQPLGHRSGTREHDLHVHMRAWASVHTRSCTRG